jgi:hypothetical protein
MQLHLKARLNFCFVSETQAHNLSGVLTTDLASNVGASIGTSSMCTCVFLLFNGSHSVNISEFQCRQGWQAGQVVNLQPFPSLSQQAVVLSRPLDWWFQWLSMSVSSWTLDYRKCQNLCHVRKSCILHSDLCNLSWQSWPELRSLPWILSQHQGLPIEDGFLWWDGDTVLPPRCSLTFTSICGLQDSVGWVGKQGRNLVDLPLSLTNLSWLSSTFIPNVYFSFRFQWPLPWLLFLIFFFFHFVGRKMLNWDFSTPHRRISLFLSTIQPYINLSNNSSRNYPSSIMLTFLIQAYLM